MGIWIYNRKEVVNEPTELLGSWLLSQEPQPHFGESSAIKCKNGHSLSSETCSGWNPKPGKTERPMITKKSIGFRFFFLNHGCSTVNVYKDLSKSTYYRVWSTSALGTEEEMLSYIAEGNWTECETLWCPVLALQRAQAQGTKLIRNSDKCSRFQRKDNVIER